MTPCAVCPEPALGIGTFPFLCLPHALVVIEAKPAARVPVDLRGRCWGQALECPSPAVTSTPHGGWCETHRPGMPTPRAHAARDALAAVPELEAAVAVVAGIIGGEVLRTEPRYGDIPDLPPLGLPPRSYTRSTPSRAVTVPQEDPCVPRTARNMLKGAVGWQTTLKAVTEPPSVVLKAQRGPLRVAVRWDDGKFAAAWLQHGRELPVRLGARQATAILRIDEGIAA